MSGFSLNYRASRTAAKFHGSRAFVRGIRGPIGSGKSVACVLEMWRMATLQPHGKDGWRRSRWAAIRNTYPELESTTIRTFQDWFPDSVASINWGAPITATVRIPAMKLELEVIFLAVDRPKDVKKLKSLELTGANGGANVFYLYAERVEDGSTDGGNVIAQMVPVRFMSLGTERTAKARLRTSPTPWLA